MGVMGVMVTVGVMGVVVTVGVVVTAGCGCGGCGGDCWLWVGWVWW